MGLLTQYLDGLCNIHGDVDTTAERIARRMGKRFTVKSCSATKRHKRNEAKRKLQFIISLLERNAFVNKRDAVLSFDYNNNNQIGKKNEEQDRTKKDMN